MPNDAKLDTDSAAKSVEGVSWRAQQKDTDDLDDLRDAKRRIAGLLSHLAAAAAKEEDRH